MIRRWLQLTLLLLILVPPAAYAAGTVVGERCDLAALGASDKHAFLMFDSELRTALSKRDKAALALLVSFPLRVNHADGSATSLVDARALQTRFDLVFPPAIRSAVLDQELESLFCKFTGVMYGGGAVWIGLMGKDESQRYRVTTVNLSAGGNGPAGDDPRLEFICDASPQRIVIDTLPGGKLRYRSWTKPKPLAGRPDTELSPGVMRLEGTSPCTYTSWTFESRDAEVSVSELGCTEGPPPPGATGSLAVTAGGEERTWWCY